MQFQTWHQVLKQPADSDHIVQTYQDRAFLAEAVAEYIGAGLRQGDAAIVIARPEHAEAFQREIEARGGEAEAAVRSGRLVFVDADAILSRFMIDGLPSWKSFKEIVGGLIADTRGRFPSVRTYGDMVDILWQGGKREAAVALEHLWNDLAKLEKFSLFCAYHMNPLDSSVYGGALEAVCKPHTHFIPARDYARLDEIVHQASTEVLDEPQVRMLWSLSADERRKTHMPIGQATLLWLGKHMPRTADKILRKVRALLADQA